jgi:hypothetical protein
MRKDGWILRIIFIKNIRSHILCRFSNFCVYHHRLSKHLLSSYIKNLIAYFVSLYQKFYTVYGYIYRNLSKSELIVRNYRLLTDQYCALVRAFHAKALLKVHIVYATRMHLPVLITFSFSFSSSTLSVDHRHHRRLLWLGHCRNDCDGIAETVAAICIVSRWNTATRRLLWGRSVLADLRLWSYLNQIDQDFSRRSIVSGY